MESGKHSQVRLHRLGHESRHPGAFLSKPSFRTSPVPSTSTATRHCQLPQAYRHYWTTRPLLDYQTTTHILTPAPRQDEVLRRGAARRPSHGVDPGSSRVACWNQASFHARRVYRSVNALSFFRSLSVALLNVPPCPALLTPASPDCREEHNLQQYRAPRPRQR